MGKLVRLLPLERRYVSPFLNLKVWGFERRDSMLEKVRAMGAREKESYLNDIEEAARYNEAEYGSTVRCILYTLHKYLGLYDDERVKGAIKAAAAFPGGIAGNTEVCGGMIAGVMAISLV